MGELKVSCSLPLQSFAMIKHSGIQKQNQGISPLHDWLYTFSIESYCVLWLTTGARKQPQWSLWPEPLVQHIGCDLSYRFDGTRWKGYYCRCSSNEGEEYEKHEPTQIKNHWFGCKFVFPPSGVRMWPLPCNSVRLARLARDTGYAHYRHVRSLEFTNAKHYALKNDGVKFLSVIRCCFGSCGILQGMSVLSGCFFLNHSFSCFLVHVYFRDSLACATVCEFCSGDCLKTTNQNLYEIVL